MLGIPQSHTTLLALFAGIPFGWQKQSKALSTVRNETCSAIERRPEAPEIPLETFRVNLFRPLQAYHVVFSSRYGQA